MTDNFFCEVDRLLNLNCRSRPFHVTLLWKELNSTTVRPAYKVPGCKVVFDIRYIFGWTQSESAKLGYNPVVRSVI